MHNDTLGQPPFLSFCALIYKYCTSKTMNPLCNDFALYMYVLEPHLLVIDVFPALLDNFIVYLLIYFIVYLLMGNTEPSLIELME